MQESTVPGPLSSGETLTQESTVVGHQPPIRVLSGHVSPETAHVVADYPYGFRLRCQIRYWIETTKHGQRVVSQTTNPKRGDVWNKPKASTYSDFAVLYVDNETGHVKHDAIVFAYADEGKLDAFVACYGESLTDERATKAIRLARAIIRARKLREMSKEGV